MPEEAYAIYDELARGGVGTIITGFTSVAANDYYFEGMMRLCDDALISQYGRLADIIHAQEAAAIAQLALGAYYRSVDGSHFQQVEPDDIRATRQRMGFFIIRCVLPDALSSFFDSLQYLTESNRSHMIHGKSGIQSQICRYCLLRLY